MRTKTAQANSVRTTKRTKSERIVDASSEQVSSTSAGERAQRTSERTERSERLRNETKRRRVVRPTKMFVFRTGFVQPALPTPQRQQEQQRQQQAGLGPAGLSVHNIYIFFVGRGCSSSSGSSATAAAAGQGSHISWDNYCYYNKNNNDSV